MIMIRYCITIESRIIYFTKMGEFATNFLISIFSPDIRIKPANIIFTFGQNKAVCLSIVGMSHENFKYRNYIHAVVQSNC